MSAETDAYPRVSSQQKSAPAPRKAGRLAASKAEAQFLASYSAPAGHWQVDGYGFSRVADEHPVQPVAQTTGPKCWYVLDVKLCD